ncbi:MAG: oligosaccharide flippase family protein [Ruminococcus sp.]|nr:oligosaccharide flippase family protein [Ruminococcus sp.]
MSRESKLAKNTLILSVGTFLPKLATFVTLPVLTGYLTQEQYGTYDLITVLVSLLLPAATLQIQAAAFRFLIDTRDDKNEKRKIISNIYAYILPSSAIALIILFFCLHSQSVMDRSLICLYFLMDILVNATRQVCRGLSRTMDYSVSAIISSLGKMVFALIFVAWLKTDLTGAIIALCGASTLSFFYLFFRLRVYRYVSPRYVNKALLKDMLRYSWPMVPNSMSAWVMRVSDRLVVTSVMGVAANAVYAVANKIPSLLNLAQSTFTLAWQENASIASKDEDAGAYYSSMFRTMYDLMAGFFGVLIAATPLLFKLLIRGSYGAAYKQMPILFLGMFFFSMSTYLGGIYVAYKASKSVGITTMAAAAINLLTDIGTIHFIGLYAASGSTLVSYIFLFLYRIKDVQKLVRVSYDPVHLIAVLLVMLTECVLSYLQMTALDIVNIVIGIAFFVYLNRGFIRAVMKLFRSMWYKLIGKSRSYKSVLTSGTYSPHSSARYKNASDLKSDKPLPELYSLREGCCGCSACYAVCPAGAIEMEPDEEGFEYPVVDGAKCIGCKKCIAVCSFKPDQRDRAALSSGKGAAEK